MILLYEETFSPSICLALSYSHGPPRSLKNFFQHHSYHAVLHHHLPVVLSLRGPLFLGSYILTPEHLPLYFWPSCFLGFSMSAGWWQGLRNNSHSREWQQWAREWLMCFPVGTWLALWVSGLSRGTDWKYLPVPFIQIDEVNWGNNWIGYSQPTCVWIITGIIYKAPRVILGHIRWSVVGKSCRRD